jgi:hypothetical protein
MPEVEHAIGLVDDDQQFVPDYEALDRLAHNSDFQALVAVMQSKTKAARRHLDAKQTDDWQDVGFYRGHIFLMRLLYRLITKEAHEKVCELKNIKPNGGK